MTSFLFPIFAANIVGQFPKMDAISLPIRFNSTSFICPAFSVICFRLRLFDQTDFCSFDTNFQFVIGLYERFKHIWKSLKIEAFDAFIESIFFDTKRLKISNIINSPIKPIFCIVIWHEIVVTRLKNITVSEKLENELTTEHYWKEISMLHRMHHIPGGKAHVEIFYSLH